MAHKVTFEDIYFLNSSNIITIRNVIFSNVFLRVTLLVPICKREKKIFIDAILKNY